MSRYIITLAFETEDHHEAEEVQDAIEAVVEEIADLLDDRLSRTKITVKQ